MVVRDVLGVGGGSLHCLAITVDPAVERKLFFGGQEENEVTSNERNVRQELCSRRAFDVKLV